MESIYVIYQMSIQIILSNFEGNDAELFKALDNKIDTDFLIKRLQEKSDGLKKIVMDNVSR